MSLSSKLSIVSLKRILFCLSLLIGISISDQIALAAPLCPDDYISIRPTPPTDSWYYAIFNDVPWNATSLVWIYEGDSKAKDIAYFNKLSWVVCYKIIDRINFQGLGYSWNGTVWTYVRAEWSTGGAKYDFKNSSLVAPVVKTMTWSNFILPTNSGSISLTLSGITDPDEWQTLSYKYQWNWTGGAWINSGLTSTTPKLNWVETISVFGGYPNLPEGSNTLYVQISDSEQYSNIYSVFFIKAVNNPLMTVVNPDANYATSKTVTLTGTYLNNFTLSYNISTSSICDKSGVFTPYAPVVIKSTSDNGKYVCFRAMDSFWNALYTVSDKVTWIVTGRDSTSKTSPVKNSDLFANYSEWYKGSLRDYDPIFILVKSQVSQSTNLSYTWSTFSYPNLITDINGDGLPDLIVTNFSIRPEPYMVNGQQFIDYSYTNSYGLLLNRGNMDYEVTYRCVRYQSSIYTGNNGYYGDCAQ